MQFDKNYAYVTLLGSDNYLKGTLGLICSLKKQKPKYPIIVLVTNKISNGVLDILKKLNIKYKLISEIEAPQDIKLNNENGSYPNWTNTFSKLMIFGMIEFDKIVFLDSDMMVLKNIDELFEKDNLSATIAGKSYPGNETWKDLNSGIMVVEPKKNEEKRLLKILNGNLNSGQLGDQDIIRLGYPYWKTENHLHLNENYNIFSKYEPYYLLKKTPHSKIKIIHFVGSPKPWEMTKKDELKYYVKLVKMQLKNTKSIKGLYQTIIDFKKYKRLCKKFI